MDRRKLERVSERLIRKQRYVEQLGKQLLVFRGRGGSGKTIHLLRLAKNLYDDYGSRILLLTYNKALVADLTRLCAILGISDRLGERAIHIQTAHQYFVHLLGVWGLWPDRSGSEFPESAYQSGKAELLDLLGVLDREEMCDDETVRKNPKLFAWDYVMVDECQDWPDDERDLIYTIFGPARCILADGRDQLVRSGVRAEWVNHQHVEDRQVVPLRRSLRLKSNLCRFVEAFAAKFDLEWDLEANEEVPGGRVVIFESDYQRTLHEELMSRQGDLGNFPIDALFCDDSSSGRDLVDRFREWEKAVWDGTTSDGRNQFPTDIQQHRVVRYESCRGLEGWTVVCLGLDRFFERKRIQWQQPVGQALLQDPEETAKKAGVTWCLIPLTRALDTLVLQVCGPGKFRDALYDIHDECRDFTEWRRP